MNGYQFHMDLMAGRESWTDERVRNVFTEWEALLPYHQENPNGRTWQEAAAALVSGEAGMMTLGNFVGEAFPEEERSDLDFFPWPAMNEEFGTDTIEAPIDGWMLAANPANLEAAKELLYYFGTADAQGTYLSVNPNVIGASLEIDTANYTPLQLKVFEAVSAAPYVTQFLDRDTSPEFAANVAGQAFADFISDPSSIDGILEDMQAQAEVIFAE
jgi:multiple sugar transport system substrate-binding protein